MNTRAVAALGAALVVLLLGLGLAAGPAVAAPSFGIELTRDTDVLPTVHHSDERVDYMVKVTNTASASPSTGDSLSCDGASPPEGTKSWIGTPAPSFAYEWRRNGVIIPGATSQTYVVTGGDEGKVVQCLVKGSNASAAAENASMPGRVVEPQPSVAPPAPHNRVSNSRPTVGGAGVAVRTCTPPAGWTITATARTTSGSNQLTAVTTAKADAALVAGSNSITLTPTTPADTTRAGVFRVGQAISSVAGGIPAGTTIVAIDGETLELSAAATEAKAATNDIIAGSQPFAVGEAIVGNGIPPGTQIDAIDGQTITLSNAATATATVIVSSASTGAWGYQWLANGEEIPGATGASYTPNLTATGTATRTNGSTMLTAVNTTSGSFAVGDVIAGTGLQPNTEIVAVEPGVLHLSIAAASSGGGGPIAKGPDAGKQLQCLVTGSNAGGALVGTSNPSAVALLNGSPSSNTDNPGVETLNSASGLVSVTLDLPAGAHASRFYDPGPADAGRQTPTSSPAGWACTAVAASGLEPAKAICTRSGVLNPGASYPPFSVAVALGPDTPDTATVTATASGGGAGPTTSGASFDIAPALSFGLTSFSTFVHDASGDPYTKAGGHPNSAGAVFELNKFRQLNPEVANANKFMPIWRTKRIDTDTPRGFVGNPLAVPELCPTVLDVLESTCPVGSAVGGVDLTFADGGLGGVADLTVYAIEPEFGRPAQFAFSDPLVEGVYVLNPRLRPGDGYAVTIESAPIPSSFPSLLGGKATICSYGTNTRLAGEYLAFDGCKAPGDSAANPKPFVTLPPRCGVEAPTTVMRVTPWQDPSTSDSRSFTDPPLTGCGVVQFDPLIDFMPTATGADSASGLGVELSMPADGLEDPYGTSQAHLRKTVVELPEGVAVNPSAATGLEGCSDEQLGLGTDSEPQCPDGSKIATVTATTPVLEDTLEGVMVLRTPKSTAPMSGEMFRMALIVENDERGLLFKLAGSATADPQTGKLTATFDENPELPIGTVNVDLKGGDRGVLAMPQDCGQKAIDSELSSWKGDSNTNATAKSFTDPFTVGGACSNGFAPELDAGMDTQTARANGKFAFKFTRRDGEQWLRGLTAKLPKGLLASVKDLPLCSNAQADAGSCPQASRIGTVDAKAGSGDPFVLEQKGEAFLTDGYKGGAYGLAVKVRPVAGPFRGEHELSPIIVRQAIHVDRTTAQVMAVSDPFPLVHHGVPLRVREVMVLVDRDRFMLNPSGCDAKQVGADILSAEGTTAGVVNHFQAVNCATLPFKPKLAMQLTGKKQVTTGKHPGIKAKVTQTGVGEAGIGKATVRLPKSLALDPDNAQALCEFADGTKPDLENHCPKGSVVGRARATSPLLNDPLVGNVYFVKNIRTDAKTGNQIRTLPMIMVALRGEIAINLKGESNTTKDGKLVNTFDNVPDAPVSQFNLNINGGKTGIIAVTRTRRSLINLCASGRHVAEADMDGHNGRRHDRNIRMKTPCTKKQTKTAKRQAKRAARRG